MKLERPVCGLILTVLLFAVRAQDPGTLLRPRDVVAVLGGAPMVALQRDGVAEALAETAHPDWQLRFRSLAWEGDTVFSRPRELNFPTLTNQLRQAGATVSLLQFGGMESFAGDSGLAGFLSAYGRLLDDVGSVTPRRIVLTPSVTPGGPNASDPERQASLKRYSDAIRELALRRGLPVMDSGFAGTEGRTVGLVLGGAGIAARAGTDDRGRFTDPSLEAVRQAVIARNRLWFDYSRPMNWAFLAGDRTEQPSSRDHRDRNVRWFPAEMERFVPLIAQADEAIWSAAKAANREVQ